MDNLTHSLAGAALAATGLRRTTPLATATLVLAANAPDVDAFVYLFGDSYDGLAFRRGWTHGPIAMAVLPFVVAAVILGWDRWVRRRRRPDAPPARPWPVVLLALLGGLTHPALDWMNTYGIRLLMPFDRRWFYGDALFIIDPWVWLLLGATVFLAGAWSVRARIRWVVLAALATTLVVATPIPVAAKLTWSAGLAAILTARRRIGPPRSELAARIGQWGTVVATLYILLMVGSDRAARRHVLDAARDAGIGPVEAVMVAPLPADPFGGEVVIRTPDAYHTGDFRWFRNPQVQFGAAPLRSAPADDPVVRAAAQIDAVRDFLVWSRFPFYEVTELSDGWRVLIGDARYARDERVGGLAGLVVLLDRELREITE